MSAIVTLDIEQLHWAYYIGFLRVENAHRLGLRPRFPYKDPQEELRNHTYGALGELALAVFLGLRWSPGLDDFKLIPDVAPFWEARHRSHNLGLKVSTDDPPERLVVDITGTRPTFEIHGFIVAEWAQKNVPLTDPGDQGRPAHFVNPYYLTPVDEDFHSVHAWFKHSLMGWMCLYCGELYEAPETAGQEEYIGAR